MWKMFPQRQWVNTSIHEEPHPPTFFMITNICLSPLFLILKLVRCGRNSQAAPGHWGGRRGGGGLAVVAASSLVLGWSAGNAGQSSQALPPIAPSAGESAAATIPTPGSRAAQIAEWLESSPRAFLPPASNREAWNALPLDREKVIQEADEALSQNIPPLPDELYLEFGRSGERGSFEKPYGDRLKRAKSLALGEAVHFQGKYLPALKETVEAILNEKTWVMPASDGKQGYPAFYGKSMDVDIGAAARAASLATIYQWLGDQLGSELKEKLRSEIIRRCVDPFLDRVEGRQPKWWWMTTKNNWNAVCHAGIVYAALATEEDKDRRAKVVAAAENGIGKYLKGFAGDGYCYEGMNYWNYGLGHFVLLAETLARATSNRINLFQDSFGLIAAYPFKTEMAPGVYPVFADDSPTARPEPWLQALLARHVNLPGEPPGGGPTQKEPAEFGKTLYQTDLSLAPPAAPQLVAHNIVEETTLLRSFFPEAQVLIGRTADPRKGLAIALKGGNNGENHGHNDLGTYVVCSDGVRVLADPGAEVYTKRTFSPNRYDSKVLSSYGHPVPVIAHHLQQTGAKAQARLITTDFADERDRLVLDLIDAYNVPGLEQATRTFVFDRTGTSSFKVTDDITLSGPASVEVALVTFGRVEVPDPSHLIIRDGAGAVKVSIESRGVPLNIKDEEIQESLIAKRTARRIGLSTREPVKSVSISLTIEPLSAAR